VIALVSGSLRGVRQVGVILPARRMRVCGDVCIDCRRARWRRRNGFASARDGGPEPVEAATVLRPSYARGKTFTADDAGVT